ncbi:MAG: peptidylprolyl isomerase [Ignavibacteriales bacterium]|nr:peptidylprolyl isomerase [Ignavibacteriales bacterium]
MRDRVVAAVFALFSSAVLAPGCISSGVIGTVGEESITLGEFEEMYAKNNGGWEKAALSTLEERQKFLELLVKYRLKLMEAKRQGLLDDSTVREELAEYRKTVASTFMIEKEIIEPNLKKLYDRKKEEIRASHVLIRVSPNASEDDKNRAYLKLKSLVSMVEEFGFDSVAARYSEDPSAAQNLGDLGWFTQGRMVIGEMTAEPIQTQFGYHIVKLTGRRQNVGSVRVSHILKRFNPATSDTASVRDTIFALYRRILQNELSFAEAVRQYSDDPSTTGRAGDMGIYEWNVIPPDVAELLHATPINEPAPPHRASYGFHIFKATEKRPIPSFSDAERDLRKLYQERYYSTDYDEFLHRLKRTYQLNFDVRLRSEFPSFFDSEKTPADSNWSVAITSTTATQPLLTYGNKKITVQDFLDRINASDEFRSFPLTAIKLDEMIDRIADAAILEEHASSVGQRHPSFDNLMKEYEHGVLIYQIDQNEIWQKIAVNDSVLTDYYERNSQKYRWPRRLNIAEIHVRTDSIAALAYERLKKGGNFGDLAAEFTVRPGFKEKRGEWGLLPIPANRLTNMGISMRTDSITTPFPHESGWSIITVVGRDSARAKTFDEALPEITSHYQEHAAKEREQEWIDSLKRKYGVTIDPGKLSQAFTKRESR